MPEVFISHATADDDVVTRLHTVLTGAGIDTWVDHMHGIVPGDNWSRQIQEAVNNCQHGLFIISPNSVRSEYCEAEWQRILAFGKRLYLAMIEEVPLRDFPLRLGTIQYVNLASDFDSGLAELVRALHNETDLDRQAPTTASARQMSGPFPRWHLDLPLLGRDSDLQAVQAMLKSGSRVVDIIGLGGVGKTRLAVEVASRTEFKNGVIWHEIRPYSSLNDLTLLIRDHLGLDTASDAEAVWEALGKSETLIVLDSTEECAQPATYADRLNKLDIGSGTRVLATGRHQWPELRHARSHDLHSLDALSAVAILRAMAEQEPPTYPLMGFEHQIASAARCHPRLLQYAVRWADTYPPEHVLESLRTLQGADAQEALDDMIRKTVHQLEEQPGGHAALTALRRLAVCRSGFTFDSALALIGGPKPLALLKQWGLVGVEAGRYDVQPLVVASVGIDQSAGRAHYEFYRMLAKKHDDKQDYQGLDVESANLEAAFEWAMTAGNAESAFMLANTCRHFLENRGRFDQQMSWIERVAAALAKSPDEALRAAVQNSLGLVYQNYPGGDRRLNLRRAIAAFKEALQSRTLIGSSLAYAGTQNNLGNAYCALADVEDRAKNLKRAVAAYEDALRYYTPRNAPSAYAGTQNNLGNAYRALAEVEGPAQNLQRATVAYQVALRHYTPTTAPLAYAGTQNNLGNAYADLAAVEDRAENLQRAVEAYQEALRLYTPTSAPLEYAMAQNNLGIAYRNLADVRDRPENLRLAVEAYQQALTIYTPTSAPLDYAMTQNNLGNAYRNLAAVKGDAAHLHRATAAYQEALRFYTPTAAPLDYAMTQNNLGSAYRNLADLEEPEANLRRAVAAYDEALRYRTPFTSPLDYAMTQRNLGIAQEKLGDLRGAIAAWRKAERSYRQMGVSDKADLMLRWIGDAGG